MQVTAATMQAYTNPATSAYRRTSASLPPQPSTTSPHTTASGSYPPHQQVLRQPSKQFASITYELLLNEIVHYYQRRHTADTTALEHFAFTIGQRLSEQLIVNTSSLTIVPPLEKVKYLCKEIWLQLYGKQIDKLQTNYKGIYVLHDYCFRWCQYVIVQDEGNVEASSDAQTKQLQQYTAFPCALMRGVLSTIGLTISCRADTSKWPAVLFTCVDLDATAARQSAPSSAATTPMKVAPPAIPPPTARSPPQPTAALPAQIQNMQISAPPSAIASTDPSLPSTASTTPTSIPRTSSEQLLAYYTAQTTANEAAKDASALPLPRTQSNASSIGPSIPESSPGASPG